MPVLRVFLAVFLCLYLSTSAFPRQQPDDQTGSIAGTVQDNLVSGDWFVIPGSGTGQLAGLRGEGGFRTNLGEGAQVHLDYWFE